MRTAFTRHGELAQELGRNPLTFCMNHGPCDVFSDGNGPICWHEKPGIAKVPLKSNQGLVASCDFGTGAVGQALTGMLSRSGLAQAIQDCADCADAGEGTSASEVVNIMSFETGCILPSQASGPSRRLLT